MQRLELIVKLVRCRFECNVVGEQVSESISMRSDDFQMLQIGLCGQQISQCKMIAIAASQICKSQVDRQRFDLEHLDEVKEQLRILVMEKDESQVDKFLLLQVRNVVDVTKKVDTSEKIWMTLFWRLVQIVKKWHVEVTEAELKTAAQDFIVFGDYLVESEKCSIDAKM